MRRRPLLAVVSLAVSCAARAASAQNLVANPTFQSDVSGWREPAAPHTLAWTPAGLGGVPGAALVTNGGPGPEVNALLAQCVDDIPAGRYTFRGRFRIEPGQASTGFAAISITYFRGDDCAGFGSRFVDSPPPRPGEWQSVSFSALDLDAPLGSVFIEALLTKENAGGTLAARFDDFSLAPTVVRTLTIPAAASIHGINSTYFHSDLWAVNRSFLDPLTVHAVFRCFAGSSCGSGSATFTLAPRESTLRPDALAALFGATETAGAIELTYDASIGELAASSRVYTPSLPAPTLGAEIPAFAAEKARTRTLFLGLGNSGGDARTGFRTNAGVYNPGDAAVDVTFTLLGGGGGPLGTFTRSWGPSQAAQINDVFANLGAGAVTTRNASLAVSAPSPVFAYVTVIDNQSGDSVFVPAGDDREP